MKNQRSLCIKMYCSDDVSSFPSCSSHIVDGQPLEDSNEDNDKTKNFVRIVSGHQLNRFAAQRSQLVISGQTRGYTGVTPIPNHQTEINSRGDSYVGLKSSQHSQIKTLESYQLQAERQHERKRKLYFTEKIESEPNREVKPPKFRSYKTFDIRLKSFIGFESNCVLPVEMFARSGFFYKGFADIVACFQCGFVHRKWQHGDDPIKIHMQMNPDCYHITELRNKGILSCDNFIDESEIEYDMKDLSIVT